MVLFLSKRSMVLIILRSAACLSLIFGAAVIHVVLLGGTIQTVNARVPMFQVPCTDSQANGIRYPSCSTIFERRCLFHVCLSAWKDPFCICLGFTRPPPFIFPDYPIRPSNLSALKLSHPLRWDLCVAAFLGYSSSGFCMHPQDPAVEWCEVDSLSSVCWLALPRLWE